MKRPIAIAVVLMALSGQVLAKVGTPGTGWFIGTYERVGRDGSGALLNDQISLVPLGDGLQIMTCSGQDSTLSYGPAFEIVNLLSGSRGQMAMDCLFHKDGNLRPILTCRAEDGASFTLWPMAKDSAPSC